MKPATAGNLSPVALIRRLLPVSRAGLAWLVWKNREPIVETARFAARVPVRLRAGGRDDVIAEARLRTRLIADPRARTVSGLTVSVHEGVARLGGTAEPAARAAALRAARATTGVRRVLDEFAVPRGRLRLRHRS